MHDIQFDNTADDEGIPYEMAGCWVLFSYLAVFCICALGVAVHFYG